MCNCDWSNLPQWIVVEVLSSIPLSDALHAALTCRQWHHHFKDRSFWRSMTLTFCRSYETDKGKLNQIQQYGRHVRTLTVRVDQSLTENRLLALEAISMASKIPGRQIRRFSVQFIGENPIFYGGQEFVQAIRDFFSPTASVRRTLTHVDLSALHISISDQLVRDLNSHHATLECLDLQNRQLVGQVSPSVLVALATGCPKLRDLRVFHSSLSVGVFEGFVNLKAAESGSLEHLSILCRRQEKYLHDDLTEEAWEQLVASYPKLKVTFKFDYTCPLGKVRDIMKTTIPVEHIYLETYTTADVELIIVSRRYAATLKKLEIQTQPSDELDEAIVLVAQRCQQLTSLKVMCPLSNEAVEQIHQLLPLSVDPRLQHKFVLKSLSSEFLPWRYDKVLDEIRTNTGWPRHMVTLSNPKKP